MFSNSVSVLKQRIKAHLPLVLYDLTVTVLHGACCYYRVCVDILQKDAEQRERRLLVWRNMRNLGESIKEGRVSVDTSLWLLLHAHS